jgi:hypothetical protein
LNKEQNGDQIAGVHRSVGNARRHKSEAWDQKNRDNHEQDRSSDVQYRIFNGRIAGEQEECTWPAYETKEVPDNLPSQERLGGGEFARI